MSRARRRVVVAITARPSYSRIKSALQALRARGDVDLKCLCSGAALSEPHGRVVDRIRADGFEILAEAETLAHGNEPIRMVQTTERTIAFTAQQLEVSRPDWVITIADRHETLGTAIAASYLGIPLIHVQGGEITGNIDERVRHAISKLSDVHLVASSRAAERLIRMGEHPHSIYVTGCPSIDLARESLGAPREHLQAALVEQGAGGLDLNAEFIVVLQHADTTESVSSREQILMTLRAVASLGIPMIIFHPNSDAGSQATACAVDEFCLGHTGAPLWRVTNIEGRLFPDTA